MKLNISDSDAFLNDFLSPLSRISDGGVLEFKDGKITSLVSSSDSNIIIYGEYTTPVPDGKITLNIPDFKKLHKLLSLINGPIELEIDGNSVSYSSDATRFKYHLYEDGVLSVSPLNMSKLKEIDFNCTFSIINEQLKNLIKGSTLSTDVKKVYFTSTGNKMHAEITDKNRHLVDSYATLISENYTGNPMNSIPLNMEMIRILSSSKIPQFQVKYASSLGVFNFEVNSTNVNINYIVSALTK